MIRTFFNSSNSMGKAAKRFLIFGGINLILLSIIVFVFPEILAYAVASLFFIAGITLIGYGLRIKKPTSHHRNDYGQTIHFNY